MPYPEERDHKSVRADWQSLDAETHEAASIWKQVHSHKTIWTALVDAAKQTFRSTPETAGAFNPKDSQSFAQSPTNGGAR